MPKRKNPRKNKNNMLAYLILVGFVVLIGFVLSSHSNGAESYAFCEKLKELDNSANYTKLKEQLKNLCGRNNLSKEEQELGNLSVEFMKSLSNFNVGWKENESIAKEYAKKTDSSYLKIKEIINISSSEIPVQVDSLYRLEVDNIVDDLNIQYKDIKNVMSSIEELDEKNNNLTISLEKMRAEEENNKEMLKNLSLIYNQRKNESNNLESNLSFIKSEYEKVKNSFFDNLFPFQLIGIVIGGMIGFALSLKWKKEKTYWDAYSSSAKVRSPLKLATVLTVALLVILLLYLFLSGKLEAIFSAG